MYPIYRFTLSGDGSSVTARPQYKSLAKDIERESGEQFYREKLNGELTFVRADYTFIMGKAFDTKFTLVIEISYDAGGTWATYWTGYFYRTDCTINETDRTLAVKPNTVDAYDALLAGIDKEFNLIDLAPAITPIKADKRPMVQVYVPGDDVVACFLSGMWWEEQCTPESDETKLVQTGNDKLNFFLSASFFMAEVSGTMSPTIPDVFTKTFNQTKFNPYQTGNQDFVNGSYTFRYYFATGGGGYTLRYQILRNSDSTVMWQYSQTGGTTPDLSLPRTVTLTPAGGGASGNVTLYTHEVPVYCRLICDVLSISGNPTYTLPADDIVGDNKNYQRVIGYNVPGVVYFSVRLSATPTEWGLYQPGQYYQEPYIMGSPTVYPVSRRSWARESIWFCQSDIDWLIDQYGRAQFTIRDAYPIYSVISVLLGQIAPGVTHDGTTTYSEFLYDTNPISGTDLRLFITPKSNIIYSNYDQPAQKAPVTLRQVLDMLRDCYRCYWWIDSSNHFRIEHIDYFRRGGSYLSTPSIGIDLTATYNPRNGKPLAFGQDAYKFDKLDIAERYEFGWMDEVTQFFEGWPINITSNYAEAGRVEKIAVAQFTSDIDYILLNPGEISKDGFVLIAAGLSGGDYVIPYYNDGVNQFQNGYAAFVHLQLFYAYDMPAPDYTINGVSMTALGTKRLKVQEKVVIPCYNDPNTLQLVKTNVGNGTIRKISVDLQSRSAETTLEYDTE